ncbi:hypothetical protein [Hyphomicrobium sp. DY-1]|uniref:hypothetical protein n=1 Tax=Hyphomicrobium sp. DY-1 TaxID=3075650 RepID=UPI0039C2821D
MFVFKPQIDTSSLAQDEPPPSTFLETLEANTEILGSAFRNSGREEMAYDARNDAIFNRLGVKLENPARQAQGYQLGGIDWRGQYDKQLKDLQAQYPDASDIIRADVSPATEAAQQTATVQQRAADTAARYPYRLPDNIPLVGGQSIPSMAGGLITGATDPFTAPTLLIAPTRVAEGAAGVLWAGLRSGAANAVGSAAEQPYIAAWKKQAGLEHTLTDALKEVAANAAFGFVADVGVRGLYRGGQALAGRRPVLDEGGNVIGYQSSDSPPADPRANPLQALDDAASAAPPGSVLRKAAELDPDALRELARHTGLDADPAVRGALDALEQDRADLVPPPGVMDLEHISKANDAIAAANDPKALPVGDAIVGGHGPDAAPERLREVLARDPIELAADIRETPEILAEGLPWTDPKLKAAAQLSKLSDQAFDMVAGGEVDPRLGTIVAEHVADPDQHAPLLRQLSEAAPATPDDARAKLADLLAGPRDDVAHARTAGIADELVDRPVTLVDDPYGADGMRQLEQLRRDLSAEIEEATGVKPKERDGDALAAARGGGEDDPLRQLQADFDRVAAAHDQLTQALDRAIGRLPDGVTAKSFADIEDLPPHLARDVQAARSAGYRIEALTDRRSGNIWIAVDALNPDAILSHETIHALRQVGLLTDNELKILANKFREVEAQLSQYLPNAVSLAEYERLYRSLPPEQVRDAVMQEAAAHLYEARANGANFGKKANAILRKIKQFLERVKNALNGLGWQNAEDVMRAIDSAEIGRRGPSPASGTPTDPALKASVPATTAAPAVDDFSASVDALKDRFGIKTRQRDFGNDGSLFSLKDQQPLTLREEVEQLQSGSRLAVVARHLAAFGGDTEDILGVIQKASRVDVDAASVPELQRYIVSLEDLQQVIEDRVQHGYELGDDVDAIGELISGKLDEVSSRLSEISDQADNLASDIGEKFDELHERYETLLDERFGDDAAAREAYEESGGSAEFSASAPAIYDAAGQPKPGDTALEILGREADASAQYLSRYDVQAKALLELNPETMDLPTVEAAMEHVSEVHGQLASVKHWADKMSEAAWHRSGDAVDQAAAIKERALTPQIEKLENARDAIAEKVDAADEALQRKQGGGALFSLRDDAQAQLKEDLAQVAAIADAKAKAQRERQALIDEKIRQNNERFVTTLRDARGQVDPAKALVYLLENHGQVDLPAGMTSVAAEQKAVEAMAKAGMEEVLHTFRPELLSGKTRETARLRNVVRELAGEGTGDVAAKALAQAWIRTSERLRQEFNAAGGDIPKLEGWFLPQVHDRGALLAAGRARWVDDIYKLLDLDRIVDGETRKPLSPAEIRQALSDIWENITSDGHGTQAANAADPFGGITGDATGAKKIANQRQEHRFLHFKSADTWLDYQKQYGGGNDPFRAMMQHITSISKDIAAMRVLGTNPNRELARLAKFATKQAKLARPAAVLIDEAVSKIKDLTAAYLKTPTRLDEVSDRIGAIHKEIARIREKRFGPPSRRNKKKIEALRTELFALDAERIGILDRGSPRIDGLEGAQLRQDLEAAYDELAAVQDVDKVLFPKKTEFLGKTMTQSGFWTTAPEDYARSYISRAEAMWDLYRGVTSAPVNAKAASLMQMLRNVGVVGRGGSMVISSIADNFTQVMARRFTGLPAHKTFTDILRQLGPNAHREAQRQALIGETYLHMFNDGARGAASLQGPEWSHWLAERTIALQGLGALTDAQRQAFGMSLQAAIADLAVKSWGDVGALNPRLQKLFQRYGLGEAEWDAIRLDPATGQVRDVDFLSPNLVRDSLEAAGRGNERIAERYLGMILQESDFASPTSMLRARAAMVGKTRPGTLVGEFLRTAGQFKQFSFMFGMLHFERALREGIANGTLKGASYAAQTLLVMTLGGALVVQLKDLKGGKDTRPMDKPGFWGAALMQGGGLGIVGDIFNSEQNRFGGGLVSTFAGPVFGLGEDILGAAGISPKTTAARGSARLATSYVPGSSLWYLNLAYQRTVADTLQRYVDPKAYDAFRRRQMQQLKDYGNGFWWAPGQSAPSRAPRLN